MPTILVVDDSAVDRCRVAGLLRTCPDLQVGFAVDGRDALLALGRAPVDLVLTDLIMPEMDGLELVSRMTSGYPLVPVILMTGLGNEETAVRALTAGAASYVPKSLLASLLVETVQGVLEAARQERCELRLMDSLTCSETTFRLGADASVIGPLLNYLHRTIRAIGWCDQATGIRVCVALEEALNNALFHGNLEITSEVRTGDAEVFRQLVAQRQGAPPFCRRGLEVYARFTRQDATFVVRDDGPGFDPRALPDPTAPENLEKASGRGLLLMRTFMDSVEFNARGNEVTMIKRAPAAPPPDESCAGG